MDRAWWATVLVFLPGRSHGQRGLVGYSPSILAWKIPRTEVPGGLQSMGSQESDMT